MQFSSRIRVKVSVRLSAWLVSGYAHALILLCVVIVPRPVKLSARQNETESKQFQNCFSFISLCGQI